MNMNTDKNTPNDPIGQAILDYAKHKKPFDIIVSSDLCDDDIIPIEVLFRSYKEMPDLEKKALSLAKGKVLDAGAGAGVHALELIDKGLKVKAIDTSDGAVTYMRTQGIDATAVAFMDLPENEKFDTILMLMNGIGIAGELSNLKATLEKAKRLLNPGGQLLFDSSDVHYLYEDEDGSVWMDLNTEYYGNFKFQMHYKKISGPWFNWLYVDYETMHNQATELGFKSIMVTEENDHYLAQLQLS